MRADPTQHPLDKPMLRQQILQGVSVDVLAGRRLTVASRDPPENMCLACHVISQPEGTIAAG
jgi:hypothetical protein